MDVIYTDKNYIEQGYLRRCSIDLEIGRYGLSTNDFEISLDINLWDRLFNIGSLWYVEGTEYGGIVEVIKISTRDGKIFLKGKTFRGLFEKEYVQPPTNQAYLVLKGDMNNCIKEIVEGRFDDLVVVDKELSNIQINKKVRDLNLLEIFEKMSNEAKVDITFKNHKIHLKGKPINDLSNLIQYDNSLGLTMVVETPKKQFNHILALGKGELTERLRVNLYLDEQGQWSTTKKIFNGLSRVTYKYEDTNEENSLDLTNNAISKVNEIKGTDTVQVTFNGDDSELFDIVSAKEEITGISFKEKITKKIMKAVLFDDIQNINFDYKVGDD